MPFESNNETGRISIMKGSRQVLVKVMRVATLRMMPRPISLLILNALYKGFQMRYHFFQKFFGKMVKIKETSFLSTREDTNFLPPLYNFFDELEYKTVMNNTQ